MVLLYKKEGRNYDQVYTRTVATPNGWTFVIPNVDSVSYGYLYNNNITSKEDARKDFLDRFELPETDGELIFENYMAKNMFVGERTVLNGNMYGFVEPMEATSLQFYQDLCRQAWDGIFNIKSWDVCNGNIRRVMKEIETFILWHYQYGSKYDTPFWEYAKSLPFYPDERFRELIKNPLSSRELDMAEYKKDFDEDKYVYGQWKTASMRGWKDGME